MSESHYLTAGERLGVALLGIWPSQVRCWSSAVLTEEGLPLPYYPWPYRDTHKTHRSLVNEVVV